MVERNCTANTDRADADHSNNFQLRYVVRHNCRTVGRLFELLSSGISDEGKRLKVENIFNRKLKKKRNFIIVLLPYCPACGELSEIKLLTQ